jgi:hypothetical protein
LATVVSGSDSPLEHYCAGSGDQGLHAQVRYRA